MPNDTKQKSTTTSAPKAKAKPQASGTSAPSRKRAERDSKGNVIDPPVIPSYERELIDATALGDDALINEVTERYTKARTDLADRKAA